MEGAEGEGKERGKRARLGYLSRGPRVPSYATVCIAGYLIHLILTGPLVICPVGYSLFSLVIALTDAATRANSVCSTGP